MGDSIITVGSRSPLSQLALAVACGSRPSEFSMQASLGVARRSLLPQSLLRVGSASLLSQREDSQTQLSEETA